MARAKQKFTPDASDVRRGDSLRWSGQCYVALRWWERRPTRAQRSRVRHRLAEEAETRPESVDTLVQAWCSEQSLLGLLDRRLSLPHNSKYLFGRRQTDWIQNPSHPRQNQRPTPWALFQYLSVHLVRLMDYMSIPYTITAYDQDTRLVKFTNYVWMSAKWQFAQTARTIIICQYR